MIPPGSEFVVTVSGITAAFTVMRSALESDRFAESVTLTVKSKPPAVVGVPDTTPLPAKLRPGGSVPADTDHAYGGAPLAGVQDLAQQVAQSGIKRI